VPPSPGRRWGATFFGLMGLGASCPGSISWHQCWGASGNHNSRDVKGHLPPREWSPFLRLTILFQSLVQQQGIVQGISGQPLECYCTWPLACSWGGLHLSLFSHSPWDSSAPAGIGFIISTKGSNSTLPGDYLCCPLLQEQVDPMVWTDGMTVGWIKMDLLIHIRLKDSSVSTSKTVSSKA
jgi:hypothetical protein